MHLVEVNFQKLTPPISYSTGKTQTFPGKVGVSSLIVEILCSSCSHSRASEHFIKFEDNDVKVCLNKLNIFQNITASIL